jgi:hypothetical protein
MRFDSQRQINKYHTQYVTYSRLSLVAKNSELLSRVDNHRRKSSYMVNGGFPMNTHRMSPLEIRKKGLEALAQALGPVGMVRFLQQFGINKGDYTEEREKLLEGITMDDILAQVQQNRKKKQSDT